MKDTKLKIFIDDIEVMTDRTLKITEEVLNTSSVILNNVYPKNWEEDKDYISRFYYPLDWSNCEIYIDDEMYFSGIVKNSGDISLNPRYPKYAAVEILDYKTLLSEGKSLDFVISGKTIEEAIHMVIDSIKNYGFEIGEIKTLYNNEVIGAYSTLDKKPYDVLQYLSEISESRWFARRISKEKYLIEFYDPSLIPKNEDIEYTTEYFEKNNIQDMKWSFGTRDYRNKQVILSEKVYASINNIENPYVNGYSTSFPTEQMIGNIIKITVNGEEKTFVSKEYKKLGIEADFYYTPGEKEFESNGFLSQGVNLSIEYQPIVKGREIDYNHSEITRISNQIKRNGTIERYERRNDISSGNELRKTAKTYIKYKGLPEIVLKIVTYNKDIFQTGTQVHFNFDGLVELNTDYLVKKKNIEIYQNGGKREVFFTYTLSSNFDCETAINYFDNQRRKFIGNIEEGEFITRNIDINNQANIIFDNLEVEIVTVEGDNTLDSILDAPFNQ